MSQGFWGIEQFETRERIMRFVSGIYLCVLPPLGVGGEFYEFDDSFPDRETEIQTDK